MTTRLGLLMGAVCLVAAYPANANIPEALQRCETIGLFAGHQTIRIAERKTIRPRAKGRRKLKRGQKSWLNPQPEPPMQSVGPKSINPQPEPPRPATPDTLAR